MTKKKTLNPNLLKHLHFHSTHSSINEPNAEILKALHQSGVSLGSETRILCEENQIRWRVVTYFHDSPYAYLIEYKEEELTLYTPTETGLSERIWDYYLFELRVGIDRCELQYERNGRFFINGWERQRLKDKSSQSRWDFFFRPDHPLLSVPHEGLQSRITQKITENKTVRFFSLAVLLLAFLSLVFAFGGIMAIIPRQLAVTLTLLSGIGSIGSLFLTPISAEDKTVKKVASSIGTRMLKYAFLCMMGFFLLIFFSFSLLADNSEIIVVLSLIALGVLSTFGIYKVTKANKSLRKLYAQNSELESEIAHLRSQIPRKAASPQEITDNKEKLLAQSKIDAMDFLNIDRDDLLSLNEHTNTHDGSPFVIIAYGGIQSTSRISESPIARSFFTAIRSDQADNPVYGVYFIQLLYITKDQVLSYSFFYNAINDEITSIHTEEYYLLNIVSLSSKLETQNDTIIPEKILQKVTFRLAVENGAYIQVSLLSSKVVQKAHHDTPNPDGTAISRQQRDQGANVEDPFATAFQDEATNAERAVKFIRHRLKEMKRKETVAL